MPFSIESMFLVRALVVISHVIPFAIDVFEGVRAWFALLGFKTRRVQFKVGFAAPGHVSVMFDLMRATTSLTFGIVSFACKGGMSPFLAVVALWHPWIHVGTSNSGNDSSVVEGVINE